MVAFGHPDLQFWRSRNPSGTHPDTPAVVMRHQVATSSGLFWQPRSITSREAGGTAPMARQLSCGPLHTTRPSWSSGEPARLNGAEQSLDGGSELREALFQRRGKRIEPVRRGDEIFERLARHGVLDPHRNDRQALGDRPLDFALDLRRSFACCEKISTSTLAPVIAVTIDSPQSIPGTMSRGRSSNGYRPARASHRQRRPTPHPVRIADEDVVFHHPSLWRARSSRSRQSTMASARPSGPSLFKMKECCVLDVYCAALAGKGGVKNRLLPPRAQGRFPAICRPGHSTRPCRSDRLRSPFASSSS